MKKICIVTTSLGSGGAERFGGILSQMLFRLNYEVHILTIKSISDFEYSGKIFNLEAALNGSKSKLKKAQVLKRYFNDVKFDVIIDNRTRNKFFKEYIIYKYLFKAQKIIPIIHSYNTHNYIPSSPILAKILYSNVYKIVCVSKKIKEKIVKDYNFKHIINIYNPVDFKTIVEKLNKQGGEKNDIRYILFFGRIQEKPKNLSLLVKAYNNSELMKKNVLLYFLGNGEDVTLIKEIVKALSLTNYVVFLPFTSNPYPYVKEALFTVLTSRYEGFPLSLIESLACGTPVISVDCNSGPSEVIKHRENGLLIENHNVNALSSAMDELIDNESLYVHLKQNASKSVKHLQVDNITMQWKKIIDLDDEGY
ncbi:MAG: glycosyltransferase [Flavobacteriales bacterium]